MEQRNSEIKNLKTVFLSKENFISTARQFIKFGFVGIINTGISLATYYIFVSQGMNIYLANTLGFLLSVINAYAWNALWVFKGNSQGFKKTIAKFFVTYISTYLLSLLLLYLFVDLGGMSKYLAPIINVMITMFLNFFISKFWTFKK